MLDRRQFLRLIAAPFIAGAGVAVYATLVEPFTGLRVTRYRLCPSGWPQD